jgi:CRP-like cAMP-binding protein
VIFYSAGDIFGELAAIDGMPRSASAIVERLRSDARGMKEA